jgi:chromosome segregation ATPase
MNTDLEIKLLKETILALREELEKVRFEEHDHIQQAVAAASDEIRQLRAGFVELRERLEFKEAEQAEELRRKDLQHERERAELHRTVAALRQKLEDVNESLKNTGNAPEAASAGTSR